MPAFRRSNVEVTEVSYEPMALMFERQPSPDPTPEELAFAATIDVMEVEDMTYMEALAYLRQRYAE